MCTVSTITTADNSLLRSVRQTLGGAEEALLCVAFVNDQGVHLVQRELQRLRGSGRLLATTVFGTTTPSALNTAVELGLRVRVHNRGSGTYHPKLYLGRSGSKASAVIGSANLTGGLVNNVELATLISGTHTARALRDARQWAEELWESREAEDWEPRPVIARELPRFDEVLYDLLEAEIKRDNVFHTLGRSPKPNRVVSLSPTELFIETERSDDLGRGPQPVPAWMFNLAWDYLRSRGQLANTNLLDELRVMRSSAVCAVLGRLPPVRVQPGARIVLEWVG